MFRKTEETEAYQDKYISDKDKGERSLSFLLYFTKF